MDARCEVRIPSLECMGHFLEDDYRAISQSLCQSLSWALSHPPLEVRAYLDCRGRSQAQCGRNGQYKLIEWEKISEGIFFEI